MDDLHPIDFRDELERTLRAYIVESVPISARYPSLRAAFRNSLADETNNVQLVRGPYVESLPDFDKASSLRTLVADGLLSPAWNCLPATTRPPPAQTSRGSHPARTRRRNYLVATGTGSGKTECFLFPIIDQLLRDPDIEKPGVRARSSSIP
jgi:hypothetical protein